MSSLNPLDFQRFGINYPDQSNREIVFDRLIPRKNAVERKELLREAFQLEDRTVEEIIEEVLALTSDHSSNQEKIDLFKMLKDLSSFNGTPIFASPIYQAMTTQERIEILKAIDHLQIRQVQERIINDFFEINDAPPLSPQEMIERIYWVLTCWQRNGHLYCRQGDPITQPPIGKDVGALGALWQFPTDHVPAGYTVNGIGLLTWNILNRHTIHKWVINQNSQGLNGSMISTDHAISILITPYRVTKREETVIQYIFNTINDPLHPRSILCLQECHPSVVKELKRCLPNYFKVLGDKEEATLINSNLFSVIKEESICIFKETPLKSIQKITLKARYGAEFLLINVHLPGDPQKKSHKILARYLKEINYDRGPIIVLGDMNFNEQAMAAALQQTFEGKPPFGIYTPPYATNITPRSLDSKCIDYCLMSSPDGKDSILPNHPEEVLDGLTNIVNLLMN